jgi:hypothetical protein
MAADPITAGFELAKTVVSTIWPDKSAQEQAQLAAALAMVQGQMDINKVEAASSSLFVAGARPFILWVCGVAFAYKFVLAPAVAFGLAVAGHPVTLPVLDFTEMSTVLLGLLGLGSLRTVEKIKGVA